MAELNVELGERSYPIFIGPGVSRDPEKIKPFVAGSQVMVVTNTTVDGLYGKGVEEALGFVDCDKVVLPDGEEYKNLETLNRIFDSLLQKRHNRNTTLLALGGGVIGDMTGFAAACYQRGVNFIQIPSTLLSQVDSSVGGKTGVNHRLGKNMIGAFYQPRCVLIDTELLKSLPQRELSAGLAEVIKYGLIADADFFTWLENNIASLVGRDSDALVYAIKRSCEIKAEVVAEDEREGGLRAILNFGHTFGHAIEAYQGYGDWLHGEAVAVGMILATEMSLRIGNIDREILSRTHSLIARAALPLATPDNMSSNAFLDYMAVDKKVLDKKLRLVLLKSLGEAYVTDDFPQEALMETLAGE